MNSHDSLLQYKVGGLLYTPALNSHIGDKLKSKTIDGISSIALCLEDSIEDDALSQAERELCKTLSQLEGVSELPLLFIRVRTPQHLKKVHQMLGGLSDLLCGYVLPKFDLSNAERYMELLDLFNASRQSELRYMPILESGMVANIIHRRENLVQIKAIIDTRKEHILNVRVGGNDFCNIFGIRRHENQSIYDIGVIRDILSDIVNVFGADYIVSGPVWEYFGDDPNESWAKGLRKEISLDLINGFIGKTAIHPTQLPIIRDSMKPMRSDYEDAIRILDWTSNGKAVQKSANGARMNEQKCHIRWAKKIEALAEIYGIKEERKQFD